MDKLLLDELSQPVLDLFNGFENDLLINISKKFALNKGLLDTDPLAWQIQMMNNLGLLTKENLKLIAKQSGLTAGGINGILLNAGLDGLEVNEEIMAQATKKGAHLKVPPPVSESPKVLEILKSYEKQAKDVLNLTNQTMIKQADKIYVDIINRTAFDVISGTMTGDQALRKTIKQWGETGVPALIDSAGRRWSPEGYVRTVIRTTVGNVTNDMQDTRFDEYGVEYIEISSHAGARPKCEPYQGRVFSINAKAKKYPNISTTSQGQVDGLFGINCGHMKYAFVPGVSTQTYQPYDTEENNKIYKESQHQRAIERSIRKAKTQKGMLEASGDLKGAKGMDKTIALRQAKMRKFVKDTGRTRRSGREQVVSLKGIKPLPVKPIKKGHLKTIKPVDVAKPKPIPTPKKVISTNTDIALQNEGSIKKLDYLLSTPKYASQKVKLKQMRDDINAGKHNKNKVTVGLDDNDLYDIIPDKPIMPKAVKKDPPKPIDPNFTKEEIMEANKANLHSIDEMLKSKYTTMEEAKDLKVIQKEYKAGKWDHTKTFVGMDGNSNYKVFVDIPTPKDKLKKEPLLNGFTKKQIDTANDENIATLQYVLDEEFISYETHLDIENLIKDYKSGKYDKVATKVSYSKAEGIKFEDLTPKDLPVPKAKIVKDGEFDYSKYKYVDPYTSSDIGRDGKKLLSMESKEYKEAYDYTGGAYRKFNEYKRAGTVQEYGSVSVSETKKYAKKADKLEKFIQAHAEPLTENTIFTRRMAKNAAEYMFDEETQKAFETVLRSGIDSDELKIMKKRLTGGNFSDKGFISTSFKDDVFEQHMGLEVQILAPKGYNKGMYVNKISQFKSEGEYLMNAGQKFTIVDVELKYTHFNRVVLKVVPYEEPVAKIVKAKVVNIKKANLGEISKSFDKAHTDKILEAINDMPDEVKDLFNKYGKDIKVSVNAERSSFKPSTGQITLRGTGLSGKLEGQYTSLLHEIGHLFDTKLGGPAGAGKPSSSKSFKDAIAKDYDNLLKNTSNSMGHAGKNDPTQLQNVYNKIGSDVMTKGMRSGSIQDILGGLSGSKIRVDVGHSLDYWTRKDLMNEVGSELFAHMVAAAADPKKQDLMLEYFPDAWAEFLSMIK